jgi:hypothetical protein
MLVSCDVSVESITFCEVFGGVMGKMGQSDRLVRDSRVSGEALVELLPVLIGEEVAGDKT